jgi:hypothetical protein
MLRATDPTLALIVMVFRPVSRVGVGFDPPLQPVSPHCCYTSHLIISLKTASRSRVRKRHRCRSLPQEPDLMVFIIRLKPCVSSAEGRTGRTQRTEVCDAGKLT